jgi:hypothetical protein
MPFRLRILLIVLAIAIPLAAVWWFAAQWLITAIGWTVVIGFFGLWYLAVQSAQRRDPRTRGGGNESCELPGDGI